MQKRSSRVSQFKVELWRSFTVPEPDEVITLKVPGRFPTTDEVVRDAMIMARFSHVGYARVTIESGPQRGTRYGRVHVQLSHEV
jgi:hypothetical protein